MAIETTQIITKESLEVLRFRQGFHTKTIETNLSTVITMRVMTDAAMDAVKEKWIVLQRIRPKVPLNH